MAVYPTMVPTLTSIRGKKTGMKTNTTSQQQDHLALDEPALPPALILFEYV
jgi:hypothetical protein